MKFKMGMQLGCQSLLPFAILQVLYPQGPRTCFGSRDLVYFADCSVSRASQGAFLEGKTWPASLSFLTFSTFTYLIILSVCLSHTHTLAPSF